MAAPLDPQDDAPAFTFCPRCGGGLERRFLKGTEPERPVCTRCGFVFYLDPKIAVGTIIKIARRTVRGRGQAGVSWRSPPGNVKQHALEPFRYAIVTSLSR